MLRISRAWISMSVDWPSNPADGWWMRIRLLGSEKRLPFSPAISSSDPIDIAIPMQIVWICGLTTTLRDYDRGAFEAPCAQIAQRLLGLIEPVGRDARAHRDFGGELQEVVAVLPRQVGHRADRSLLPQIGVGKAGDVGHVD